MALANHVERIQSQGMWSMEVAEPVETAFLKQLFTRLHCPSRRLRAHLRGWRRRREGLSVARSLALFFHPIEWRWLSLRQLRPLLSRLELGELPRVAAYLKSQKSRAAVVVELLDRIRREREEGAIEEALLAVPLRDLADLFQRADVDLIRRFGPLFREKRRACILLAAISWEVDPQLRVEKSVALVRGIQERLSGGREALSILSHAENELLIDGLKPLLVDEVARLLFDPESAAVLADLTARMVECEAQFAAIAAFSFEELRHLRELVRVVGSRLRRAQERFGGSNELLRRLLSIPELRSTGLALVSSSIPFDELNHRLSALQRRLRHERSAPPRAEEEEWILPLWEALSSLGEEVVEGGHHLALPLLRGFVHDRADLERAGVSTVAELRELVEGRVRTMVASLFPISDKEWLQIPWEMVGCHFKSGAELQAALITSVGELIHFCKRRLSELLLPLGGELELNWLEVARFVYCEAQLEQLGVKSLSELREELVAHRAI